MKCLSCKNDTMINSKTTYFAHINECYIIVENVPCKKCSQCGEEFFSSSTMERLDQIISEVTKNLTKVCIMEYAPVA